MGLPSPVITNQEISNPLETSRRIGNIRDKVDLSLSEAEKKVNELNQKKIPELKINLSGIESGFSQSWEDLQKLRQKTDINNGNLERINKQVEENAQKLDGQGDALKENVQNLEMQEKSASENARNLDSQDAALEKLVQSSPRREKTLNDLENSLKKVKEAIKQLALGSPRENENLTSPVLGQTPILPQLTTPRQQPMAPQPVADPVQPVLTLSPIITLQQQPVAPQPVADPVQPVIEQPFTLSQPATPRQQPVAPQPVADSEESIERSLTLSPIITLQQQPVALSPVADSEEPIEQPSTPSQTMTLQQQSIAIEQPVTVQTLAPAQSLTSPVGLPSQPNEVSTPSDNVVAEIVLPVSRPEQQSEQLSAPLPSLTPSSSGSIVNGVTHVIGAGLTGLVQFFFL